MPPMNKASASATHADTRRRAVDSWHTLLFDLDYTLIDTRELIYACFQWLMRRYYQTEISREEVYRYIGLPYRIQLQHYTGPLSPERFAELERAHREYQASIFKDRIRLCPGVPETLERLTADGRQLGVVTSRLLPSTLAYLEHMHLKPFFKTIITPADTSRHKPFPDPILKAMEQMGAVPSQTVYIGDAVFDIAAGHAAGVETVFADWEKKGFAFEGVAAPTYCISDMRELYCL